MSSVPLLTLITFLPLLGGLACLGMRAPRACRWTALAVALADLGLALAAFGPYAARTGDGWFLAEDAAWIPAFGIRYTLAMDGISLVLVLLAAFLGVVTVLVSWRGIAERVPAYHFFLLATQTGVLGVFLATDLFLFYLFWELQLIPIFFLIGIWGHEDRLHAALKFFLFSIAGGLLMLGALIALHLLHAGQTGEQTFALADLAATRLAPGTESLLFAAFLLAFAIKIPILPVHTWLPDAHTQAPTAGSVILAGLLLKTGAYSLLRFAFPLFPRAAAASAPLLFGLGLAGLFYAAWIAFSQRDMKRLVAYSSIAHMGLIVIGVAVWNRVTLSGAVLQMVNHGLTTSALFIMVGMLDERAHSRELADFGGLWRRVPVFASFFLLFSLSSLGLPGLNNFVGEILILVGSFKSRPVLAALACVGVVPALLYALRLVQDLLYGQPRRELPAMPDITGREALILTPLALASLFLGLHPGPVLDLLQGPVAGLAAHLGPAAAAFPGVLAGGGMP